MTNTGRVVRATWESLDWSKAYVDMGPSPVAERPPSCPCGSPTFGCQRADCPYDWTPPTGAEAGLVRRRVEEAVMEKVDG